MFDGSPKKAHEDSSTFIRGLMNGALKRNYSEFHWALKKLQTGIKQN